jgi:NTE family protein
LTGKEGLQRGNDESLQHNYTNKNNKGGGALGAFQAGAFKALYERITRENEENGNNDKRPLFDIVAGTSAGAINAAVLVSHVIENKT